MNLTSRLLVVAAPEIDLELPRPRFLSRDENKADAVSHLCLATQYLAEPDSEYDIETFLWEVMGWLDLAAEALEDNGLIVVLLNDSDHVREKQCACMVAVEDTPYYLLSVVLSESEIQCDRIDTNHVIKSPNFASVRIKRNQLTVFVQELTMGIAPRSDWTHVHAVSALFV